VVNDAQQRAGESSNLDNAGADLRFGGGRVAVAGIIGGLGIALGVPAILLSLGQGLGQVVLTVLVVLALLCGATVALVSAFFGLVIPSHLRGGPWLDPDKWRRFAQEQQRHRHRRGAWDHEDLEDEAEEPPRPRRRPRA
jgi:hypothetical protein